MTRPVGLTPAWWQVLGATLDQPLPVAEIARRVGLGLARQSVQRVADLLVERKWAVYRDNPAHRRAKLLEPTSAGRRALDRLTSAQHAWADAVGNVVGEGELRQALAVVRQVIDASRTYRGHLPLRGPYSYSAVSAEAAKSEQLPRSDIRKRQTR
jgi:DNA-binding MarR family transcriptional regulator